MMINIGVTKNLNISQPTAQIAIKIAESESPLQCAFPYGVIGDTHLLNLIQI
jgi:hypothetical protein